MTDSNAVARSSSDKVYDRVTLLLLAFGGLFPPLWVVGAVLLWRGQRWTPRDRILGTLVWPLGPFGFIAAQLLLFPYARSVCVEPLDGPRVCTELGPSLPLWFDYAFIGAYVIGGAAVCVYLAKRAAAGVLTSPPTAGPRPPSFVH